MRKTALRWFIDILYFIAGSAIYGIAINFFMAPNHITTGGITGTATVLNYLIHVPIGMTVLLLNIPLFILAVRFLGGAFTVKTIIATVTISLSVDFFSFIQPYRGELVICALFGGLLTGTGISLLFMRGGTSGGTDIISRLLLLKWRHFSIGRMVLITDLAVIIFAGLAYRRIENALYALIVIFTSTKVIDGIIYGVYTGKSFMIISDKSREIAEIIREKMRRGVTILFGRGGHTGMEKEVLICTVRSNEAVRLRDIVVETDPAAFITVSHVGEIRGEGFSPLDSKEL